MIIFPAIDIFGGQAVRLLRGDYSNMTVYDPDPVNTAMIFRNEGAQWIHIVDLEGARSGECVNIHSYAAFCPPEYITATTNYGADLTASVQNGNIYGVQYHPEKSGNAGLEILRSFCEVKG